MVDIVSMSEIAAEAKVERMAARVRGSSEAGRLDSRDAIAARTAVVPPSEAKKMRRSRL
jgi:hypothetical protein